MRPKDLPICINATLISKRFSSTHVVSSGGQHVKILYIIKSDTRANRDTARNFDSGRSSHVKRLRKVTSLFVTNERSQTPAAHASQNGSEERGNEWTRLRDFLPGIVKIPTSVQVSRFTTTWLSSGFHNSSKVVENSAHFEGISQQKQTWRPP